MKKIVLFTLIATILLFSKELKIATYNVENLFDLKKDGSEYKEYIPNTHNWTKRILDKKILNITQVICELNADVLGLQEIENANALNLLLKSLKKHGCEYKYSAIVKKEGSAIGVALISKIDFSYKSIKVSYSPKDRDILEATLKVNPKLKIFVNHWRSKASPESSRIKYAKALINRIKKLPPNSEYIILGDFNSNYNECVDISPKNNDTNNSCGIDTILKTYYNGRLIKLRDKLPKDKLYHYNLWSEIEPHKRWSHDFWGQKEAIDSIIIPQSLVDNEGWFYKKGSFRVFKKKYLFKKNMLKRWEYKASKHKGVGYSDHLPIYAVFKNNNKELKYESLIDKFFKLFIPEVKEENKQVLSIQEVANKKFIKNSFILKNVCLIFKRGDIGVIKSLPNSVAITLYKSAEGLQEGRCYDFKVYKKKRYYKIDEITDLEVLKKHRKIDVNSFIADFDVKKFNSYKIGDIVKNIKGIYKDGYLNIKGVKIKLFVKKKKRGLLRKNNILFIKKAQIGYYKGQKELIVYSLKDIQKEN